MSEILESKCLHLWRILSDTGIKVFTFVAYCLRYWNQSVCICGVFSQILESKCSHLWRIVWDTWIKVFAFMAYRLRYLNQSVCIYGVPSQILERDISQKQKPALFSVKPCHSVSRLSCSHSRGCSRLNNEKVRRLSKTVPRLRRLPQRLLVLMWSSSVRRFFTWNKDCLAWIYIF